MKKRIILASTSARRHFLAEKMGLEFEAVPSDYEEDMTLDLSPEELVMTLAFGKAESVAKKYEHGIVIGVDTIVVFNNRKLGKPKDKEDAFNMLKSFSGKAQDVYSGIALIDCESGKIIKDYEVTKVKFRELDDSEINAYINTGEPFGKAGAYAIQELASIFIERVEGCYPNIMGLPVQKLYQNLKKMGVNIFEYDKWGSIKDNQEVY
jgi:septum formation protein